MDEKDNRFQEQQAPLKNTDQAYVQVGHDGEPVLPKEEAKAAPLNDNKTGTLEHR